MLNGDEIETEKSTIVRSKSYERFRSIGRALSARQRRFKDLVITIIIIIIKICVSYLKLSNKKKTAVVFVVCCC